jgi:FkbM family methyltransferase
VADTYSFIWQFREIFSDQSYKFKTEADDIVIYDCGANVGLSCLYYHLMYPRARVEVFEPDPAIFQLLKQNVSALGSEKIGLYEKAVWVEDGTLDFYQNDVDSGSLTAVSNAPKVTVETIDLFKALQKEARIDFLKMDIEGAEAQVMVHIEPILFKIGAMFIEYHSRPSEPQALAGLLQRLEKAGFRYFLKTENRRKSPLYYQDTRKAMDYQTNIYAYRAV